MLLDHLQNILVAGLVVSFFLGSPVPFAAAAGSSASARPTCRTARRDLRPRRRSVDPAALLAAPVRTSTSNRSYCPRCRVQYVIAPGACADCPGVPLVELAEAGPR